MRNRFSKSVKSVAEQFVWSHWHCLSIRNLCQRTREAVTGQIEIDIWTNTLWQTPKKLSHRCLSSSHFDVSKHLDVDNYVRSRFFCTDPSLMICHSWLCHWHKWRNACHIVRETVLVTSAKRFDFDCLKIPPDVKLSSCISDENVCRIASKRNRASAVVSECKQCQAVTAKCLPCAWTLSNTGKYTQTKLPSTV